VLEEIGLAREPHRIDIMANENQDPAFLALNPGRLISADLNTRHETIQWVMWQMGGVGPMFGQVGFFKKFAGKAYEDKRPRDRYASESARHRFRWRL
jgi:GST-like protein